MLIVVLCKLLCAIIIQSSESLAVWEVEVQYLDEKKVRIGLVKVKACQNLWDDALNKNAYM